MTAKDLVTYSLPVLTPSDTGNRAIELMEEYKLSHLPLVDRDHYVTLISEDEIYDNEYFDKPFSQVNLKVFRPFVSEKHTLYDVLALLGRLKITVLPVLSPQEKYLGSILVPDLIYQVIDFFNLSNEGAVITVKQKIHDYSLVQLAQIIEANNAKILSFSSVPIDEENVKLILKLNVTDAISILQTLERYDYEVENILFDDEEYKKIYQERLDALLSYLSI